MPFAILTPTERDAYEQIPTSMEESILRQHFHFTGEDKRFIHSFYGVVNRIGIAFQVGFVHN